MRTALLCLCLVVVAGCKVKNPNFCDGTDMNPCTDAGVDAAEKCSANMPCTTGLCKEPPGVCVQCLVNADCSGTTPVCDGMNRCQACSKHTDCPSNACMPNGSCAIETDVLYVANTGTNNAMCSKAMPCSDVSLALAATPMRSIVRVTGTITAATISIDDRDITMLGDPKTSILNRTSGDVMQVDGTAKVKLYDMTISNAAGNNGIHAVSGHTGELELQRCFVNGNGLGIQYAGTGQFTLARSEVSVNLNSGGVFVTQTTKFDITNNFIYRNGNTNNSNIGGISITSGTSTNARFEFNTIVDNQAIDGSGRSGGAFCDINNFVAANNLIARNQVSPAMPTRAQVNGACNFTASFTQADFTNLIFTRPDTMPYDYHLGVGSVVIDTATTGAALTTDYDGQARPNPAGTIRDKGADEFYAP